MTGLGLVLTLAVVVASALIGFHLAVTRLPRVAAQRTVDRRLRDLGVQEQELVAPSDLIKAQAAGPVPMLDRVAARPIRGFELGRWIEQSGTTITISGLLVKSAALGTALALIAWFLSPRAIAPVIGFAIGASVPFVVLRHRRRVRLRKFEEQFPEALDLISRAVRAGHAFNTGMKMVADEVGEPVGPEFRKTFDEQNFGLSLKDSLNNLAARVPLLDMKFFVTAVLIQRETGGNLSEILDNLGHVVRERFKILRQVQVYTAHGRFTGYVLLGLPAALSIVLYFINPDHMNLLFRERMGQMMLMGTLVMQTVGYLWIKKIVKIEV